MNMFPEKSLSILEFADVVGHGSGDLRIIVHHSLGEIDVKWYDDVDRVWQRYKENEWEYTLGMLLYYYSDDEPWTTHDFHRATDAVHYYNKNFAKFYEVPGPRRIEEWIGFKPAFNEGPDEYYTVRNRVKLYGQTAANDNILAEGAD